MLFELLVLWAQSQALQIVPSPFDEVRAIEIGEESAAFEGHGRVVWVDYESEFIGTLHLWTRANIDLFLHVEKPDGKVLGEDQKSGGGLTPFLELPVQQGDRLRIGVVSEQPRTTGWLELHLTASPETEQTRDAAGAVKRIVAKTSRLSASGQVEEARDFLKQAYQGLSSVEGNRFSLWISMGMASLATSAKDNDAPRVMLRAVEHMYRQLERTRPIDHKSVLRARTQVALARKETGDLSGAQDLEQDLIETYERMLPPTHILLVRARHNLSVTLLEIGEYERARELLESVLDNRLRRLKQDDPEILSIKQSLALALKQTGKRPECRVLEEEILKALQQVLPADDPDLILARINLAESLIAMGEIYRARPLLEQAIAAQETSVPSDQLDHLRSLRSLALLQRQFGEVESALALESRVLDVLGNSLPKNNLERLELTAEFSTTLRMAGNLERSFELGLEVLAGLRSTLPEGHEKVLRARLELSMTMSAMGALEAARDIQEELLDHYGVTVPREHPDRLRAQMGLAETLVGMGDLSGAQDFMMQVLIVRERVLPGDHPSLSRTRKRIADVTARLNDPVQALNLLRSALDMDRTQLGDDHPSLLSGELDMANLMMATGARDSALELAKSVLEERELVLPKGHDDIDVARSLLARILFASGDFQGARANLAQILEERTKGFGPNSPDALSASDSLAASLAALGNFEETISLLERVYKTRKWSMSGAHPLLISNVANLALAHQAQGQFKKSGQLRNQLLKLLQERIFYALPLGARGARIALDSDSRALDVLLYLDPRVNASQLSALFSLIETRRAVQTKTIKIARAISEDHKLTVLRARADEAYSQVESFLDGGSREMRDKSKVNVALRDLTKVSNREQEALRTALDERGLLPEPITPFLLSKTLPDKGAAVGFLRHTAYRLDESSGLLEPDGDHLLAMILDQHGELQRVDLGPIEKLESLITRWRVTLGAPLNAEREAVQEETVVDDGLFISSGSSRDELEAGRALHSHLMAPILSALPADLSSLFVCPDDLLHLIPIDAIPAAGERLGDRLQLTILSSFSSLFEIPQLPYRSPQVVAIGAVDYGARVDDERIGLASIAAALPPTPYGDEGPVFAPLSDTKNEVHALSSLFNEVFGLKTSVLLEQSATKPALARAVPGVRFLHLATSTWFSERGAEASSTTSVWRTGELAPAPSDLASENQAGIALSGANGGRVLSGRVPGIASAEELAALDLSICNLAFISCCSTDLGRVASMRGIRSLRTALHGAGAQSVVISLWKADPAVTQDLIKSFYTHLWRGNLTPSQSLAKAKSGLRVIGHPAHDWASWVLSR